MTKKYTCDVDTTEFQNVALSKRMKEISDRIAENEHRVKNLHLLAAFLLRKAGGSVTIPKTDVALNFVELQKAVIVHEATEDGSGVKVSLRMVDDDVPVDPRERDDLGGEKAKQP